jgi:site-specific recombinase XerD
MGDGRDLASLVVPAAGELIAVNDRYGPFRMTGPDGVIVEPVTEFFRDLLAAGRSEATVRSYGMGLLRWFRFTWAAGIAWDRADQRDARDFSRWLLLSGREGKGYAPAVRAHSETVLRGFYAYPLEAGTGPVINPFPLDRARRRGRPGAHRNPMEDYPRQRSGRYRPRLPSRVPRAVSDEEFNAIFAELGSNRDRALVAFYVSTGARASELLSATVAGTDPGWQLITVVRKGTRELAQLPASPDAFVWLRLYQAETGTLIPPGRRQPLWWTLRRPVRPLTYHAAHRMFERVNQRAGTAATLHALRHTAAFRMADDPSLPLTDVQAVLGHAQLTTTQIYTTPRAEDVIRRVLAHHGQTERQAPRGPRPPWLRATGPRPWACCSGPGHHDRQAAQRAARRGARGGAAAA